MEKKEVKMKNKKVKIIIGIIVLLIVLIACFYFFIVPMIFGKGYGNPCRTFGPDYKAFNERRVDEKTGEKHTYSMCCKEDKSNCIGLN